MKMILLPAAALLAALVAQAAVNELPFAGQPVVGAGDTVPPPAPVTPTDEQMQAIQSRLVQLRSAIAALKVAKADDTLIVDAESCLWVVENVVRVPGGFINK